MAWELAVSTFEPGCRDDGTWGEEVAVLKLGDVEFVAGVEGTITGDKTEDKVVALGFHQC